MDIEKTLDLDSLIGYLKFLIAAFKKIRLVKFYLLDREIIKYSRIVCCRLWKQNAVLSFRTRCLVGWCEAASQSVCVFYLEKFCYDQKWSSNERQISKCSDLRCNAIKTLGIYLQPEKDKNIFYNTTSNIQSTLNKWRMRSLTLERRIVVFKTLALSKKVISSSVN